MQTTNSWRTLDESNAHSSIVENNELSFDGKPMGAENKRGRIIIYPSVLFAGITCCPWQREPYQLSGYNRPEGP
jgi:hypothetical protein